jgi:hypothetical protein
MNTLKHKQVFNKLFESFVSIHFLSKYYRVEVEILPSVYSGVGGVLVKTTFLKSCVILS